MDENVVLKQNKNANWSHSTSECLLNFLVDHVINGNKTEKGFKSSTIAAAARHVNEKHKTNYTETNIQNRLRFIRRSWKDIQKLKFMDGNTYDHETNTIVMDHDVYTTYIKAHASKAKFINKPIKFYAEMEIICGNELATRASAKKLSHNSSPLDASRVRIRDPSSPIIQTIGDEVDGEDVPVTTPGAESAFPPRAQSVTPSPRDKGLRKRKLCEEESFGQYFTEMKEVLQGLNTNRTVALAKEIKTAIATIPDEYPSSVLRRAQRYLVQNEVEGACFMTYNTVEKIEWMDEFMLSGMGDMSGTGSMRGIGGAGGMRDMSGMNGASSMNDAGGMRDMDGMSGAGGMRDMGDMSGAGGMSGASAIGSTSGMNSNMFF